MYALQSSSMPPLRLQLQICVWFSDAAEWNQGIALQGEGCKTRKWQLFTCVSFFVRNAVSVLYIHSLFTISFRFVFRWINVPLSGIWKSNTNASVNLLWMYSKHYMLCKTISPTAWLFFTLMPEYLYSLSPYFICIPETSCLNLKKMK